MKDDQPYSESDSEIGMFHTNDSSMDSLGIQDVHYIFLAVDAVLIQFKS